MGAQYSSRRAARDARRARNRGRSSRRTTGAGNDAQSPQPHRRRSHRDQRLPREVSFGLQPRGGNLGDPAAQRRPRHGAHAHQGSTGRQGRAGRSAFRLRRGALRAEGAADTSAAGRVLNASSFHIGFIQPSHERVNEINRRLRDDGFAVDPPAHLHGSWTFYFTAPGGFTIEVLS